MDTNVIYCGDCLIKLKDIPDESIDLIYIDPPFSSNRNYVAFWQEQEKRRFEDRFENVRSYIDYMTPRLKEMYRVLKSTGSFYYHCDWHASHYIKILLDSDYLFGYHNFRNEIIWQRYGAHNDPKRFGRVTDTILFYSKSDNYIFNPIRTEYSESHISTRFNKRDPDGRRFWPNTCLAPGGRGPRYVWNGHEANWRFTREKIEELDANGEIYYSKSGIPYRKNYLDKLEGQLVQNLWIDIKMTRSGKERLGYPTQKPEKLLERIITASSNEGDIVLDAFCGCGTTPVVAQRDNRKWIGIDISPTSCRVMAKRLEDNFKLEEGKDFYVKDLPKTAEELRQYPAFEFQNWAVNALGGVPSKAKVRDGGIDGKLYPIEDIQKTKVEGMDLFGEIDRYIPIQVKRTDQVGRPDIENFEVAMKRDGRKQGIFVGFDFSRDAEKEVRRAEREEDLEIELIKVSGIIEKQLNGRLK